jgi:hypothetical protein
VEFSGAPPDFSTSYRKLRRPAGKHNASPNFPTGCRKFRRGAGKFGGSSNFPARRWIFSAARRIFSRELGGLRGSALAAVEGGETQKGGVPIGTLPRNFAVGVS